MSVAVVAEALVKRFGAVVALDGIGFTVSTAELFGLIGPDGAGKTTLFRILATLLLQDSGHASMLGRDTRTGWREIRKRIGYMPGRFSLYQDLSVRENLEFFATVAGTTVRRNYDLIEGIYSRLEPFETRRAGALSGGMKQKLALCCALVHRPELLLLDEPTTGVDAVSRQEFWQILARLKGEGITMLVSTPYMDEASLCDRVAFMQKGRVLAIDTPACITRLFTGTLFSDRANDRYRLIRTLRQWPHAESVQPFGSSVHCTVRNDASGVDELQSWLISEGISDATAERIDPGIEDTFMALMEERGDA